MEDLFKEIGNPREKKLISDARDLLASLDSQCDSGRDLLDQHKRKNEKLVVSIRTYFSDYKQKNSKLRRNFDVFNRSINDGSCIKSLQNLDFNDLFDVPVDATTSSSKEKQGRSSFPTWFSEFKRDEFDAMRENLEILAKKMYKARVSEEFLIERDAISKEIDELIEELELASQPYDWEVPKEKLVRIEQSIIKLMQFDMVLPQIMADVLNRASEFSRSLYNSFLEFRNQSAHLHTLISNYQTETDRSMRTEFMNINFAEPERLRTKRYGISLRNEELASLQEGRTINEKVMYFIMDYFHERSLYYKAQANQAIAQQQNSNSMLPPTQKYILTGSSPTLQASATMPMSQGVFVMKSNFFEALLPPGAALLAESMNYDGAKMFTQEYRGFRNTIFDRFARILLGVQITTNNWILVEIKNHPDKEILIYDSDMRFFAGYHERVCSLMRRYIVEEIRNKADLSEAEAIDIANAYIGRTVATPQNNLPQDNGIYFAKNLQLCGSGNNVHSASYRLDHINAFRLELFTFLVRLGINVDRTLPYEILI